jgi:hypothetical protein
MKNLYIVLLLLVGVVGFGQTPKMLGNIIDQYGKKYSLDNISISPNESINKSLAAVNNSLLCSPGMFDLYFETGSGMEDTTNATHNTRRAVVCQVFQDLSNFINSPLKNIGNTTRIKIWIRDIKQIIAVPNGVGGLATSFYNLPNNTNIAFGGIADNEIWKTIHTGKDSYLNTASPVVGTNNVATNSGIFYHGLVALNFETAIASPINWNISLNAIATGAQTDLYTFTLHEVCHALGLASLIDQNGASRLGAGFNYFSRYDRFLKNNANTQFLINNTGACSSLYNYKFNTALSPSVLYPGCTTTDHLATSFTNQTVCTSAIKFVGSSTIPVYTPVCYESGSSLSHFEDQCFPPNVNDGYFVMSNLVGNGITKRFLKPEERNALADIGYAINGTYGNNTTALGSFKDYLVTATTGISVAGTNDGIDNLGYYTFAGNSGSIIPISGILSNDYAINAVDLRFECLQDVYDATSTLSVSTGTGSTIINFSSTTSGLHLLRYVPYNNLTGQRGNITHIYVYVVELNNCASANACNLVSNGDFEQKSGLPTDQSQLSLACNWNAVSSTSSTEYYHFDATNNLYKVPCNLFGNETDRKGLKGYIGMYASKNVDGVGTYYESVRTQLSSPLQPNTNYQLSFDVSLAEAASANSSKFQAYLSTTLYVGSVFVLGTTIPTYKDIPITNPVMLFTNSTFSTTRNGWERITFNFTTGVVAGEKYLYLGGLSNVQFTSVTPAGLGCGYSTTLNTPAYAAQGISYYYLDNIELAPLSGAIFSLPSTICSNELFTDLRNYLSSVTTNGVFTGNGIVNTAGVYSFNATNAGAGLQSITYTYVNNLGCSISIVSKITVVQAVLPTFNSFASVCSGTTLYSLPTTSTNGITGTWSPALNNTATTTYTFIPTAGQCATTASLTITILPSTDPSCQLAVVCQPNITLTTAELNTSIIYKKANWIETSTSYATATGQDVKMKAGGYIALKAGTYIKGGSLYLGRVETCTLTSKISPPQASFEELESNSSAISVSPNPTRESITITALDGGSIKSIVIASIEGKVVYLNTTLNSSEFQLDATSYKNGIYMLTVETLDGKIVRQKLIKN